MTDPLATEVVTIEGLGALGDGAAAAADGRAVFIPGGLPGETWQLHPDGTYRRLADHPDRAPARCPHYGRCGGCTTQHIPDDLYAAWKRGLVVTALGQHGVTDAEAIVAPLERVPAQSRRRAVLTAVRGSGGFAVGFHAQRSHDLVALTDCAVLVPEIVRSLPVLSKLASLVAGAADEVRFTVLAGPMGLDVTVTEPSTELSSKGRALLAEFARAQRFARVSIGNEPIITLATPVLHFGDVAVAPPPGAFTQASAEAERHMIALVVEGIGRARRVVDLFSGIGTFALPLARRASVVAMDSDRPALEALAAAFKSASGLKPVTTRVRDLIREPLSPKELADFDAVVFDPPRAGARAQAERLARAAIPRIVAVSCNPATLARDLAVLTAGPYKLRSVTPIDQFVFSAHVEVVAVLELAAARGQAKPSRSRST